MAPRQTADMRTGDGDGRAYGCDGGLFDDAESGVCTLSFMAFHETMSPRTVELARSETVA